MMLCHIKELRKGREAEGTLRLVVVFSRARVMTCTVVATAVVCDVFYLFMGVM